jgi:D-alanyl-D-alanine carboxypeptidase
MPALGTVDALQPIAAAPPNLRDEMCGRNRKRPAAEESDDDETVQAGTDVDPSSAYAVTMQNLRGRPATGPVLGPYAILTPPIPVYIGAPRPGSDAATQIAVARPADRKGRKRKQPDTAIAAAPKVDAKPEEAKPATANASAGFSLTPLLNKLGTASFAPASAESKPAPAPEAAPAPAAKPKKTAAKPAAKQAGKPAKQ